MRLWLYCHKKGNEYKMDKKWYDENYPKYRDMRMQARADGNRLKYHLMPPAGWMNDPNGLCQFQGVYHIYFQYTPFLAGWGTKIWGHYTTRDWMHFREEDPFLFPDCAWDRDGVYSGSAFVKDNQVHYFYTGNVKLTDGNYDYIMEGREQNTIHVKSADGMQAGEKELALSHSDYPQDMTRHVRDPKVFAQGDGYYMLLGARDNEDKGCALLFHSKDLEHWDYVQRMAARKDFGYMWECPDLFTVAGQTFLLACPQGVPEKEHCYQNIYQCGYFTAERDTRKGIYELGEFRELDKGFDFYAAQTFEDERGRRILLAWMGMPDADYDNEVTAGRGWIHGLAMPRVLTVRDGKLLQNPLEEMAQLRKNQRHTTLRAFGRQKTKDCCFELNLKFCGQAEDMSLWLREDVKLVYKGGVLALCLGKSGCKRKRRTALLASLESLAVFSDTSSIEIFVNGGEVTISTRVYSESLVQDVWFEDTGADADVEWYDLGGIMVQWKD